MKALVTGVAGFIGSRLAAQLLDEGFNVVGIDAFTAYYSPDLKRRNVRRLFERAGFELVEADLLADGWQKHLDGVEAVFHQAAQPGVRASWAAGFPTYTDNNVVATQRLLEAVRDSWERGVQGGLRRFVYASSSSVYGDALGFPTSEDAIPQPFSPYGVTKLAAEHLCGVYARNWGLPAVSLRYFTVYGGGQRPDMALHRMINSAQGGAAFPLFGDGTQRRDFTHVADIVAANIAAVNANIEPGTVLNLAGGSDATVSELLAIVGQLVGAKVAVERRPNQAGDVLRTGGDTTRARQLLGWQPQVSLHDGILEQIDWMMATRSGGK